MTTPTWGLPFPAITDKVTDGALNIQQLAEAVDADLTTVNNAAAAAQATADAAVPKGLVDVKGDLLAATGPDAVARLPVGTDGQVLTADSASVAGVKWATTAAAAALSSFHAYYNATVNFGTGTFRLVYPTELYDDQGDYDPATGIFTAPAAGLYQFSAAAQFGVNTGESHSLHLYVGTSTTANADEGRRLDAPLPSAVAGTRQLQGTVAVPMTAGQLAYVVMISDTGRAINPGQHLSYFSGARIR